jgi:hypothetical protein
LVIDGIDGRANYVQLPADADLAALPVGGVAELKPAGQERAVDRTIFNVTREGVYRTGDHVGQLLSTASRDPQATVDVHVRRLEALRRAGIVERLTEGVWRVPHDFVSRAQAYDAQRSGGVAVELRSQLPIERQVRAMGATWLDRQLLADGKVLSAQGFGAEARAAMKDRAEFLVDQGMAKRVGHRIEVAGNLLGALRDRELTQLGTALQSQFGLTYRPVKSGEKVTGIYRRSIQGVSGRFAMLDDGAGFSLVPWRPVIERQLGQLVSAVVRGHSAEWALGCQLGVA